MQRKQRSHYKIKRRKLFTEAKGKDPLLNQHLHRDLTVANPTADRPTTASNATDTGNGWVKTRGQGFCCCAAPQPREAESRAALFQIVQTHRLEKPSMELQQFGKELVPRSSLHQDIPPCLVHSAPELDPPSW